jgi:fructose-bisphosphate aldolase class II
MYQPMGPMIREAYENGYAVLAVNALNLETARSIIRAAEEARSPVIIDFYEGLLVDHLPARVLVDGVRALAREASVPVAISIDHGKHEHLVRQAIHAGFTSAMMDASELPFEENVEAVRRIVEFAQAYGASIEGEVGGMGAVAGGAFTREEMMTDPEQAAAFVRTTGVDALAVSYGSSHGLLPEGFVPVLDFDRLERIDAACGTPLVLHGGSGTSPEDLRRSVASGVAKVNMGADFMQANVRGFVDAHQEDPDRELFELLAAADDEARRTVREYMEPCGSVGRAR